VRSLPIPAHLLQGDYAQDPAFREAFSQWVQQLWHDKDAQISALLEVGKATSRSGPSRG
jgi:hypothetical protein